MNRKIKELADKTDILGSYDELNKFAELIIQECINIFEPPKIDNPNWSYDHSMLCLDIQDKIRRHFGLLKNEN